MIYRIFLLTMVAFAFPLESKISQKIEGQWVTIHDKTIDHHPALIALKPREKTKGQAYSYSCEKPKWEQLSFVYHKEDLSNPLLQLKSAKELSTEQLQRLTEETSYLLSTTQLSDIDATILPAYLANAQKDFAWLSYFMTGKFQGDLTPVTLWTLQLFIPAGELASVNKESFDPFSSALAALVVSRAAERLQEERRQLKDYPIRVGEELWHPTGQGYLGLNAGSMKMWFLPSSSFFKVDPPSNSKVFWENECTISKKEQQSLNGEKVQAVFFWAGLTSPKAGKWNVIVRNYLSDIGASIGTQLYVRALIESTLADANAVAFNSKYSFWVPRPSQRDHDIHPMILIPNHPSCPSAHSTLSGAVSTILSALFPQEEERWKRTAEEAGMSRVWAGIHYLSDHQAGLKLGHEVGKKIAQDVNFDGLNRK